VEMLEVKSHAVWELCTTRENDHKSPLVDNREVGTIMGFPRPALTLNHAFDSKMAITFVLVYCLLIIVASMLGGSLPSWIRLTHGRMQTIISFVAGLMLGVGLWHMLPHSVVELGSLDRALWWMMIGLLGMFFLIRLFHFHQHEFEPEGDHDHGSHHHGHEHHHDHEPEEALRSGGRLSWVGIAVGLALHTLIDGIALAAAVQAEAGEGEVMLIGFGTFLAIVLHKPLDALSITSLMVVGGWTQRARNLVNIGFSLMVPLGALVFMLSIESLVGSQQHVVIGCALAFSAGVFICISLTDLLPELQFHSHDRVKLSASLLLGVLLAGAIGLVEGEHVHGNGVHGAEHHHEVGAVEHNHDHE